MKIDVHVVTNKSEPKIEPKDNNSFKVSLKSIPEKGKANIELIKVLSNYFKVPKSSVTLLSGQTSQNKIINIEK